MTDALAAPDPARGPAPSPIAQEFARRIQRERRRTRLIELAPVILLVVLVAANAAFIDGFLTFSNYLGILNQMASPLVLAVGLTFVILLGSIDLSVEAVMGFTGAVVSLLVLNNKTPLHLGLWGVALTILVGTSFGMISGLVHTRLRIPSFMVTFSVASIVTGLGVLSYRGRPATILDPLFGTLAEGSFLAIPYLTWGALVIFAFGYVLQKHTALGAHVFAAGDNEGVLRSTGIRVDRVKVLVFTWSGFCASVAGIFGAIRLKRGEVIIGTGFLFYTITAVVVGGTSLSGGRGGVVHSLVGVLMVTVIQDAMILLGINPYIQLAVQGLIIIAAVALTATRGRKLVVK